MLERTINLFCCLVFVRRFWVVRKRLVFVNGCRASVLPSCVRAPVVFVRFYCGTFFFMVVAAQFSAMGIDGGNASVMKRRDAL